MVRTKHKYSPTRSAWFPSSQARHKGQRDLLDKPESTCKYLRWHSWRRFGAAELRLRGGANQQPLAMGGMEDSQHAQIPCLSPSSWTFHKEGPLQVATIDERLVVSFLEKARDNAAAVATRQTTR